MKDSKTTMFNEGQRGRECLSVWRDYLRYPFLMIGIVTAATLGIRNRTTVE